MMTAADRRPPTLARQCGALCGRLLSCSGRGGPHHSFGDNWMTRRHRGLIVVLNPSYLSSSWLDGGRYVCSRQTSLAWFDHARLLLLGRSGTLEENATRQTGCVARPSGRRHRNVVQGWHCSYLPERAVLLVFRFFLFALGMKVVVNLYGQKSDGPDRALR